MIKKTKSMDSSSIDHSELSKFNKNIDEWWNINGEFKTLHEINPIRINYITKAIKDHFKQKNNELSLLDVGCGGGLLSAPMARLGFKVSALDANEHNIHALSEYSQQHKLDIKLFNETVESHAKMKISYDIILCMEVVEHVANLGEFLHDLGQMLRPGGLMIISTINRTPKSYLEAIIMAEYVLRLVPRRTHDYNKFVRPSEIALHLEKPGLKPLHLQGMTYSPFKRKWQLTDNLDVNYFAIFKKSSAGN